MAFNKTVLLFSLSFILTNGGFAQKKEPKSSQQSATTANQMGGQAINSKGLKKQHFTYESAGCAEDGVVDYYFDNKDIAKIVESGAIGDGSWVNEYYYQSGKIIFWVMGQIC
jgi:hypothetical protein